MTLTLLVAVVVPERRHVPRRLRGVYNSDGDCLIRSLSCFRRTTKGRTNQYIYLS